MALAVVTEMLLKWKPRWTMHHQLRLFLLYCLPLHLRLRPLSQLLQILLVTKMTTWIYRTMMLTKMMTLVEQNEREVMMMMMTLVEQNEREVMILLVEGPVAVHHHHLHLAMMTTWIYRTMMLTKMMTLVEQNEREVMMRMMTLVEQNEREVMILLVEGPVAVHHHHLHLAMVMEAVEHPTRILQS
jgi:hypothetical protein